MKVVVLGSLLALVAVPVMEAQRPEALDSVFSAYDRTDGPGCAVAVSRDGKVLAARGFGMSDLAQNLAITPHSVFHVASVSKQFTGMSLVLLAKSGAVLLDDDIRKYLPELPSYGQVVTIRHLLTHTGGIRDQWSLLMTAGWRLGDDLITEQDVLEIVVRQRSLNFAPGTDWLYSNSGFSLAAIIVKRVTGKTLREYAEEQMFRPLQMSQTHFHDDNGMVVPGRTRGYGYRGAWKETVPNYSTVGATSLFTTVIDLVQWHRHLDEGLLGGPESLRTLLTPAVLTSGDSLQYALGIQHGSYRGCRRFPIPEVIRATGRIYSTSRASRAGCRCCVTRMKPTQCCWASKRPIGFSRASCNRSGSRVTRQPGGVGQGDRALLERTDRGHCHG